jgi:large subunit ribosomal protein L32e
MKITKELLDARAARKATKPNFVRQNAGHKIRVGTKYRKPKGYQSKMRLHKGYANPMPSPGYRAPAAVRGTNPEGLFPVLVGNVAQLEAVDTKTQCAVIISTVGAAKKITILNKAIELNVVVDGVDAKAKAAELQKTFDDAKKGRSAKATSRVKAVVAEKPKKAAKKDAPKATEASEKEDAKAAKKEQEKILTDKKTAM